VFRVSVATELGNRYRPIGRLLVGALSGVIAASCGGDAEPSSASPVTAEPAALASTDPFRENGRPRLDPLPEAEEIWECEVIAIGGSLGGVAAAAQAMQAGAQTCAIALAPGWGGQISSQGVSAIDESRAMRAAQNFSPSWQDFKQRIARQPVRVPTDVALPEGVRVADINSCWVGDLCFPPQAGDAAARDLLAASAGDTGSRWQAQTAFKGAEFDETGREITAIWAVQRVPRDRHYQPDRLSRELTSWYSWSEDETFRKVPLRLQAPPGQRLQVIDATDTGELVGWADLPHRVGSESAATTGETHARADNPECTQAFTYPFVLAIAPGKRPPQEPLAFSKAEHARSFDLEGYPVFAGESFFHYRRIFSVTGNDPETGIPARGDRALINWNKGNDWGWMDPPLLLYGEELVAQRQNWLGGMSPEALRHGEQRALVFAEWAIANLSEPGFPLSYEAGPASMLGTRSGLSMLPYIREGRRILGRAFAGQEAFVLREADIRADMAGGRDFSASAVALTHYAVDIHGCRYRDGRPSGEASSAPAIAPEVRPIQIPLAALIPQTVDNLLIGNKGIAVTHIVNGATRTHYGEWSIGAAAGAIAAWSQQNGLNPAEIPEERLPELQQYLRDRGLRPEW